MSSICKEKEKSTSSCIQNCGYKMPRAFINSKSTKHLSNYMINMSTSLEHYVFTCVMDAEKTSLHIGWLTPTIALKMWAWYEWPSMQNARISTPMLRLVTQSWVMVIDLFSTTSQITLSPTSFLVIPPCYIRDWVMIRVKLFALPPPTTHWKVKRIGTWRHKILTWFQEVRNLRHTRREQHLRYMKCE